MATYFVLRLVCWADRADGRHTTYFSGYTRVGIEDGFRYRCESTVGSSPTIPTIIYGDISSVG